MVPFAVPAVPHKPIVNVWGDSIAHSASIGLASYSGIHVIDLGVGGQRSDAILARYLASIPARRGDIQILVASSNDHDLGNWDVVGPANMATEVAARNTETFLVVSPLIGDYESCWLGTPTHDRFDSVRSQLSVTYGEKYVDIFSMLQSHMDPENPADVTSINVYGTTPASLRSDNIHPNTTGISYIKETLLSKMASLGWVFV